MENFSITIDGFTYIDLKDFAADLWNEYIDLGEEQTNYLEDYIWSVLENFNVNFSEFEFLSDLINTLEFFDNYKEDEETYYYDLEKRFARVGIIICNPKTDHYFLIKCYYSSSEGYEMRDVEINRVKKATKIVECWNPID